MDPNKLYCQANKAVFNELDARVTALEEGGGTDYTAGTGIDITDDVISVDSETIYDKTEVDALLDDKQDVLTAGDGISIVDGVISLDASWESYTLPSSTDDLDFDKYDYLFGTSADEYLLCQSGLDGILLNRPITKGLSLDARVAKTGSSWKIYTDGNVVFDQTMIAYNPTNVTTIDGTVITDQNVDTYFTDGKPNVPIIVAGDPNALGSVIPANGTRVMYFVCDPASSDGFGLSFRWYTTTALYNYIKSGTTITSAMQRGFNMTMHFGQQNTNVTSAKVYRRLK